MIDLLDKHKGISDRFTRMMQMGVNAMGVTNDHIMSPTRAMINGRETILAGTNNYMGITMDADCIKAGQDAMAAFGTGTTGSRVANGNYRLHTELNRSWPGFWTASTASCSPRAIRQILV
jgi:8-amino-7-oxononanoate synthase